MKLQPENITFVFRKIVTPPPSGKSAKLYSTGKRLAVFFTNRLRSVASMVWAVLLLTGSSCSEEDLMLEPAIFAAVSGTVDGRPWEATQAQIIFTATTIEFTAIGQDSSVILFVIGNKGEGTYTLPASNLAEYASYLTDGSGTDEFLVNMQNGSGEVVITEIDEERDVCSGSLNFTLVHPQINEEVTAVCSFTNIAVSR